MLGDIQDKIARLRALRLKKQQEQADIEISRLNALKHVAEHVRVEARDNVERMMTNGRKDTPVMDVISEGMRMATAVRVASSIDRRISKVRYMAKR